MRMARDPRNTRCRLAGALRSLASLTALCALAGCAGSSDEPAAPLVAEEARTAEPTPADAKGAAIAPNAIDSPSPTRGATPTEAGRGPTAAPGPAPVAFAEPVISAFEGAELVIPLRVEADAPPDWWKTWRPEVMLAGRAVPAALVYFRADASSAADANAAGWLGSGLRWRAWTVSAAQRDTDEPTTASEPIEPPDVGASGFWALRVDAESFEVAPRSSARASASMWAEVGTSRAPLVMLPRSPAVVDAARLPRLTGEAGALSDLGAMLGPLRSDPLQRWRVRLIEDRAPRSRLWRGAEPPEELPAIDALAGHYERRWRAGLAALHEADPDVAAKVMASLSAVVQLEDGTLLPAWPRDDGPAWALLSTLLSRTANPPAKARAAEAWLAERSASIVWVIDDCGVASGRPGEALRATLGVANLGPARFEALATLTGSRDAAAPVRIEGHAARRVSVEAPIERGLAGAGGTAAIRVAAGDESRSVQLVTAPVAVTPPGLLMGPLLAEWTMDSWTSGVAALPALERSTAARLERTPTGQWEVFVECRVPSADEAARGTARGDQVRIVFGPLGAPLGVVTLEAPATLGQGDRWSARALVPAAAIEPGNLLRLGIERRDASGARSSWPRPMLPGQSEPGRRLVRLDRWGGLGP